MILCRARNRHTVPKPKERPWRSILVAQLHDRRVRLRLDLFEDKLRVRLDALALLFAAHLHGPHAAVSTRFAQRTAVAGPISNRTAACRRDIPPSIAFTTFSRISFDSAMSLSPRPVTLERAQTSSFGYGSLQLLIESPHELACSQNALSASVPIRSIKNCCSASSTTRLLIWVSRSSLWKLDQSLR